MRFEKKLIYGVGINDWDTPVRKDGKLIKRVLLMAWCIGALLFRLVPKPHSCLSRHDLFGGMANSIKICKRY
ncbi:hypothetical protein DKE47_006240 [Acinetobacter nosocomialis]|nr:hypothetical protein DKE47_006240 [Acinetobacter nosocomialis]